MSKSNWHLFLVVGVVFSFFTDVPGHLAQMPAKIATDDNLEIVNEEVPTVPTIEEKQDIPEVPPLLSRPQQIDEQSDLDAEPILTIHQQSDKQRDFDAEPLLIRAQRDKLSDFDTEPLLVRAQRDKVRDFDTEPLLVRAQRDKLRDFDAEPLQAREQHDKQDDFDAEPLQAREQHDKQTDFDAEPLQAREQHDKQSDFDSESLLAREQHDKQRDFDAAPLLTRDQERDEQNYSEDKPSQEGEEKPSPTAVHEEQNEAVVEDYDDIGENGDNGILLVCLGGGEDEVFTAHMANLLQRQGHKVTALLYGSGPREQKFDAGIKILEIPIDEEDPLYPEGVALGMAPGEEGGVEWISGRVLSSRVLACRHLSRASWVEDVARRSRLVVTPLFLHDLCVLTLAQRVGVPVVGVLTSRVGAWWVWEQLGSLPLLSTTSVPPSVMEDSSIWSRTMNIAKHYGYLSTLRQQWQVPALTGLNPSWSPSSSLQELYANLARILVAWDPLVHTHTPPTPFLVPVGGFSFETGHMTKDVLVPALLNRAGVVTVSPGGRESWLGPQGLTTLHAALQPTSFTVLWRTTLPYLKPNVTQEISNNAKFVFKEEVPLNDVLSHPRHRFLISTCSESEVMASVSFATPVICIPITTDQILAARQLEALGIAEVVPAAEITVAKMKEALMKISSDRGYRERARKLGEEFHDQPVSAADRLLFALERVLRKPYSRRYDHKSSSLYLLQQSNADVYLLLLVLLTILMGILIGAAVVFVPIIMKKQKAKAE